MKKKFILSVTVIMIAVIFFAATKARTEEEKNNNYSNIVGLIASDKQIEEKIKSYYPDNLNQNNKRENFKSDDPQSNQRFYIPDIPLSDKLLDYIWDKAQANNLSYELILAFLKVESDFGRDKINYNKNGTHDGGIAQINSANVKWLSEMANIENIDVMNDYHSIDMMITYITYIRDYWKTQDLSEEQRYFVTVLSYNKGITGTKDWIQNHGWNNKYVDNITKYKEEFEQSEVM